MEITLTEENFESEVLKSNKGVLVDFWASWCGPCKMLAPVVEEFANEHPEIKVGKVNVDEQDELAQKYGIVSIPTVIYFEKGEVKKTSVGFVPKEALVELTK